MSRESSLKALNRALADIGGSPRPGQETMVSAICDALDAPENLLVQAGTGTGKSLGYLIPLMDFAMNRDERVLVSTATKNLQHQILTKDAPVAADAIEATSGRRPRVALLKGWNNYLCNYRLGGGYPLEGTLFDMGPEQGEGEEGTHTTEMGAQILRLRSWAGETETGDRDELDPGVDDRAWSQVSVSSLECLGKQCPMIDNCFPQMARELAQDADLVVTNHSLLGINALGEGDLFGPIAALAVDEAHELADRVREQASVSLSVKMLARISRRLRSLASMDTSALESVGTQLDSVIRTLPTGLLDDRAPLSGILSSFDSACRDLETQSSAQQLEATAKVMVKSLLDQLAQVGVAWGRDPEKSVTWIEQDDDRGLSELVIAPLHVAPALAEHAFGEKPTILTSATLRLGDSFEPLAYKTGVMMAPLPWKGIDVGSPFDAAKQGILYIAASLAAPRPEGPSAESLEHMSRLVRASGGGALVLFSSWKGARAGAEQLRADGMKDIMLQGEDSLSTLIKRFRRERDSVLVGTMSLWQGVDVVGDACRLVVIDKIPFPHPHNPMVKALTRDADRQRQSGFWQVSVNHAALMMAQGAGRLLRSHEDRGVVAVLDSRLATRNYGAYIRASMPKLWPTHDIDVACSALERLRADLPAK